MIIEGKYLSSCPDRTPKLGLVSLYATGFSVGTVASFVFLPIFEVPLNLYNLKNLKLLILLLCTTLAGLAQNTITDSSATVVAFWKKGDTFNYNYSITKERYKGDSLTSGGTSISKVTITVEDETDSTYTLNWRVHNIEMPDPNIKDSLITKMLRLSEHLNFRYLTTETGMFKSLLNWQEVRDKAYLFVDNMAPLAQANKMESTITEMKNMFRSKAAIESVFLKDVQLFDTLYGGEYPTNKKINEQTTVPNILGGEPFAAKVRIHMTALNRTDRNCRIMIDQTLDKDKLTTTLRKWMEKAGKPATQKLPLHNMQDHYDFEVELNKGTILKASVNRIVETEDIKHIEIRTLKGIPQ